MSGFRPGLSLNKKGGLAKHRATLLSEFDNDEDDFDLPKPTGPSVTKFQPSIEKSIEADKIVSSALEEDHTIFDFDSWKETEEQNSKNKSIATRSNTENVAQDSLTPDQTRGRAKYISSLLEKAKLRNFEREEMLDRKLAREHAVEEEQFGSTEKFITSAYAARLKERDKMREELQQIAAEESKNDVTKRGMGEFYSNLYTSNIAFGASASESVIDPVQIENESRNESQMQKQKIPPKTEVSSSPATSTSRNEFVPSPSLIHSDPTPTASVDQTNNLQDILVPKKSFHIRSTPEEIEEFRIRAYERFCERKKLGKN